MTGASDVAPLEPGTRLVASRDAVSADLEGETVILSMKDGVYYGIEKVGSLIWRELATPTTLGAVHARIVATYAVAPERAWTDLVAVARDLIASGLAERAAD